MATRTIRTVVAGLEGFIEKLTRKLVLDIVANLVAAPSEGGTPVDTGWARANWLPRVGQPANATAGSRSSVSSSQQSAGVAHVARWRLQSRLPIFITNNVPYIGLLNRGSSRQAPRGFVQAAIRKAINEA